MITRDLIANAFAAGRPLLPQWAGLRLAAIGVLAFSLTAPGHGAAAEGAAAGVSDDLPEYQRVSGVSGTLSSIGSDTLANLMTLWTEAFKREHGPALSKCVHDLAAELGGSFSAEHGVGKLKKGELATYKDPEALAAMRAIKAGLDPKGLMNPGKVL